MPRQHRDRFRYCGAGFFVRLEQAAELSPPTCQNTAFSLNILPLYECLMNSRTVQPLFCLFEPIFDFHGPTIRYSALLA
jgi:hypothetical protein